MAGYQAVHNLEAQEVNKDQVTHSGQPPEKSEQWNLNVNYQPRSATTFIVPPRQPRNREWWRRIGLIGTLILAIGTGAILLSVALLIFLYKGADKARNRDPRSEFWDLIVFNEGATRLVTICSAVIRVSMGFQIGFAAAAMAAVILETSGSRFVDTAMLSIQRAASSSAGPGSMIPTAWQHFSSGRGSGLLHLVLLVSAFIIALVSTLTSTIILFDFGQDQISAPMVTSVTAVGFDTQQIFPFNGISYWKSRPLAHWRFAESRPTNIEIGLRTDNAIDTGDVYRAMLPFDNATDRTSLEFYEGPAVVVNQRTACFAPNFEKTSLNYQQGDGDVSSGLHLNASFSIQNQTDFLGNTSTSLKNIICRVHNDTADLASVKNDTKNPLSGWAYSFNSVLLVNSGSSLNGIGPTYDDKTGKPSKVVIPDNLQNLTFTRDGPWTMAYTSDGTEAFNATVCYISQNLPHRYNVTISGRAIDAEPESLYEWSDISTQGNGTSILKQLGVGISSVNTKDRDLLDLEVHSDAEPWADPNDEARVQTAYGLLWSTLVEYSLLGSWSFAGRIMTNSILSQFIWPTHPEHSAVVQNIIQETGDPAQAMQALVFRFYQMLYYDWLPNYKPTHQVTTINAKDVLIPEQWTGLIVVLAIIIAHFIVTAATMYLFAQRTTSSLLGNSWQAVSQMVSPETHDVIRAAGGEGMKDKEVAQLVKAAGRNDEAYVVSSGVDKGRTELRAPTVESATLGVPSATNTELQTTTASSNLLSTIATSTSSGDSTAEAATTTATTSSGETTSLQLSVAVTTTTEATTSEAAFEPIPTFNVVGKGAQVDGQYLLGYQSPGFFVGWQYSSTNYHMTFSIDSTTNRMIDVNGNILCIQYKGNGDPNLLSTCSSDMRSLPDYASVTCEQTRDRELHCSVPAKTCTFDIRTSRTTCTTLTGTFDNFYTYSGRQDGIFLAMAGAENPGANYQSVELGITPN
ncbi:hypothetical protein FPOA_03393 [Fusarium poae]|uniref:Uncharacterized protein n=1 Tax=Fusarium poae TaxID=36050 RepID=A0A1B8B9P8_FUSPO|nr:hypothetical protein FPOA_03393 [Fusarium poae]